MTTIRPNNPAGYFFYYPAYPVSGRIVKSTIRCTPNQNVCPPCCIPSYASGASVGHQIGATGCSGTAPWRTIPPGWGSGWKGSSVTCIVITVRVGEIGVSWAGLCLKSHNSGMIEHITVCLLSLDNHSFVYYSYFHASKLSVSFWCYTQLKFNVSCPKLPRYGVSYGTKFKVSRYSGQDRRAHKIQGYGVSWIQVRRVYEIQVKSAYLFGSYSMLLDTLLDSFKTDTIPAASREWRKTLQFRFTIFPSLAVNDLAALCANAVCCAWKIVPICYRWVV